MPHRAKVLLNAVQQRAAAFGIDLTRLPNHIAMIMDGNGRFAEQKGFRRLWGHHQGYKSLKDVLNDSEKLGIRYVTVYGFSAENWRRPEEEVSGLMKLIEQATLREIEGLIKRDACVRVIGRKHQLPASLQSAIQMLEEKTKDGKGINFTLAINYGGRAEIVDALAKLSGDPSKWTEEDVSAAMYAPELPDPDLLIRTAGEQRWSNFLIWQSAYAELFVTQKTWPEFGENELFEAVKSYQSRDRKFGGLR